MFEWLCALLFGPRCPKCGERMVQITTAVPCCGGAFECLSCEREVYNRQMVRDAVKYVRLTPEAVAAQLKWPLERVQGYLE